MQLRLFDLETLQSDRRRRQDLLHCIVADISNEDIPAVIDRDARGRAEPAAKCVNRDIAARRQDLFHRVVEEISDENIPAAIDRYANGKGESTAECVGRDIVSDAQCKRLQRLQQNCLQQRC